MKSEKNAWIALIFLIVVFVMLAVLGGCVRPDVEARGTYEVNRVYLDGHTYLMFEAGADRAGVTHDPDCSKCKEVSK